VDSQVNTTSSAEFIENVKIDLFPDEVYVFTPHGDILSLPRNATVLDFAYAVHTDVGDHAVAARVDKKLLPLRARLESGQLVEIITAPSATPNPAWLEAVVTGKARTAIRQHLKHLQHEDAVDFGHRMLDRALDARGYSLDGISPAVLDRFLGSVKLRRLEELLSDIALGNRMPDRVATQLLRSRGRQPGDVPQAPHADENIRITGAERGVLSFANCCHPLPGDTIVGYLSPGKGVVVHRQECPNVVELRKASERRVGIEWARDVQGDYRAELRIEVANHPGYWPRWPQRSQPPTPTSRTSSMSSVMSPRRRCCLRWR
jgi:guanosine-3',5'-bis(diphosphate) 3'-pyrophosphohydrolase